MVLILAKSISVPLSNAPGACVTSPDKVTSNVPSQLVGCDELTAVWVVSADKIRIAEGARDGCSVVFAAVTASEATKHSCATCLCPFTAC